MENNATGSAIEKVQILADFTQQTVYLMGASFLLGSLTTLFMLLILDFVRQIKMDKNNR